MKIKEKPLLKISFSGSKINRVREIEGLIKTKKYKRVVEVFGGSCCISNNLKRDNIVQEAVANDYDQYFNNFEEYIRYKEKLIAKLIDLGFVKSRKPLPKTQQDQLQRIIREIKDNKRLLRYLSKNFVFSARQAATNINISDFIYFTCELSVKKDQDFYNNLKNIQLDSLDYKDFIRKYVRYNDRDTLIILDPPYLNSYQKQYENTFFGLCETISLLNMMKNLKNDFIYFNMVEKDSIELLNLLGFNYIYQTKKVIQSNTSSREDFMAYVSFDSEKSNYINCSLCKNTIQKDIVL